jgi:hypothetical protein
MRVNSCTFSLNGPVYAAAEHTSSPYLKYLSGRTMSFYDEDCIDELNYLESCFTKEPSSTSGGIQWSRVQGAVHVIFSEEDSALNSQIIQELEISGSSFTKNYAGPVLDSNTRETASQIFIRGG